MVSTLRVHKIGEPCLQRECTCIAYSVQAHVHCLQRECTCIAYSVSGCHERMPHIPSLDGGIVTSER
jgi:hypothetical protein